VLRALGEPQAQVPDVLRAPGEPQVQERDVLRALGEPQGREPDAPRALGEPQVQVPDVPLVPGEPQVREPAVPLVRERDEQQAERYEFLLVSSEPGALRDGSEVHRGLRGWVEQADWHAVPVLCPLPRIEQDRRPRGAAADLPREGFVGCS